MYKKEGKAAPKEMDSTVFYNRGVLIAALHVEAIRNALKAKPDGKITGEDTKKGFEKISNFTLGGLVPPLKVTPTDHEGGGLVQIWQVKDGKFVKVTDWYARTRTWWPSTSKRPPRIGDRGPGALPAPHAHADAQ